MLMAPRLIEALVQQLEAVEQEFPQALPGGIWRDAIPQDVRVLPAIVVAFVVGIPNPTQSQFFDLTIEARGEIEGTSVQALREPMDRVDVLLRKAKSPQGGFQSISFGGARKVAEVVRTTTEANSQLLFAHLGLQVTYTCAEPALDTQ